MMTSAGATYRERRQVYGLSVFVKAEGEEEEERKKK
jgi:hypothetical protein